MKKEMFRMDSGKGDGSGEESGAESGVSQKTTGLSVRVARISALGAAVLLTLLSACGTVHAQKEEASAEVRIVLKQDGSQASGGGVKVSGNRVTVTRGGSYRITGSLSDGQLCVDAAEEEVTLLLDGASVVCSGAAAVSVEAAGQVTIRLEEGTGNLLQSREEPKQEGTEAAEGAAVFSKEDLIIDGSGSLTILGGVEHGIQSRKSLTLSGGVITAEALEDSFKADDCLTISGGSIQAKCGEKAFQADQSMEITGGILTAEAGDDAFHSNRDMQISGGSLTIIAGKKGIHADDELIVDGGEILITESFEGLEANQVLIREGELSITAEDDGINANGEPEGEGEERTLPCLRIQGGEIFIDADGDGVDSNGDLIFEGGTTVIFGPEDDRNGALDYGSENGGSCILNGGTVLAAGSSGMAVTFSEDSGQPSFLCFLDFVYEAGDEIRILDETGRLLFSETAVKSGSSVVFGSPKLELGQTCQLVVGERSIQIELKSSSVTTRGKGRENGSGEQVSAIFLNETANAGNADAPRIC